MFMFVEPKPYLFENDLTQMDHDNSIPEVPLETALRARLNQIQEKKQNEVSRN